MDSILAGNKVVNTAILQYYKLMSQLCANFVPKVEWALLFTASFLNRLSLEHYIHWWKLYLAAHASRKTENKKIIYWNKTYYFILLIHYNFYILCFTDFMNSLDFHPFPWTILTKNKVQFENCMKCDLTWQLA